MRGVVSFTQFLAADVADDRRRNELLLCGTSVTWVLCGSLFIFFLRGESGPNFQTFNTILWNGEHLLARRARCLGSRSVALAVILKTTETKRV